MTISAAALAIALALAPFASMAQVVYPPAPTDWLSTQLGDHPLVGKIWSARDGRFVSANELSAEISRKRYVLLGEVHDNPDHHRLQAWAVSVAARLAAGKRPGWRIAFEMLTEDQRAANPRFFEEGASFAPRDLARAVDWEKSGWPPFDIYEIVFGAALDGHLRLIPASPSREKSRAVSSQGLVALGDMETKRLRLDQPFDAEPATSAALADELREAHCGLLPEKALPGMALVQRFRDATMADALMSVGDVQGAILIAGNGHARRDRGVPFYLERRGVKPDEIVSIMHVEVEDGKTDPGVYAPRAPDEAPAADYLWFTSGIVRPDPCEGLRERLEKRAK